MRLGVYADLRYWRDPEGRLATNRSFIRFVTSLPPRVEEVVVFGRLSPEVQEMPYPLDTAGVRFVALPWYSSYFSVATTVRGLAGSARGFWRELEDLDAVWLFGPHPPAQLFALLAFARHVPVFLGVRQDYPKYIGNRLPSRRWLWALAAAHALDRSFRLMSRRAPTVVLGEEIARNYAASRAVLNTGFSLVRAAELVPAAEALAKRWDGPELRLLTVSRLDPEKNPLLLLDIARELRERDPRWRLAIAGDGPLRAAMEERVRELGLGDAVELLGEVSNGPELWRLYRDSHAFLHVSFTEGLPQVLAEAHAAGLPIVGTDVGGVAEALDGGRSGLLLPPADAPRAVEALQRLATDRELREGLIARGCETAARETLEAQLDRTAAFYTEALAERGAAPARRPPPPGPLAKEARTERAS
jgi:glycosyltransferase involved in cell wall biosynthesis